MSSSPSTVTALAGREWTFMMCHLQGEPSGMTLGAEGMPTGVCSQIPGDPELRGSQDGSQPLPPQQLTWRASHIHCPAPGSGREAVCGPGVCCQVAVLSITSPPQTAEWICPLITPQKVLQEQCGGGWWTLAAHRFRVRTKGEAQERCPCMCRSEPTLKSLGAEGSASALLGTPRAWSWARASVQCPEQSLEVAGQAETQVCGRVTRSCHCAW